MESEFFDLYDRIRSGEFDYHQTPPVRPRKPMLSRNHTSSEAESYAGHLKDYEKEMAEYQDNMKAYRAHKGKLLEKFKLAALDHCGIATHPKAGRAWSMAWDRSSSDGLIGVLETLEELSDLMYA
jgi:hypothetical protein